MNPKFQKLYEMAYKDLTQNLLPWWMENDVDYENGGFYGVVDYDNNPIKDAPKYIVLNARLVWTFSSAYRILGDKKYLEMADRAYKYLIEHFYDKEYGGFISEVDCKGNVTDDHKFAYGNAFALYGLSEYVRATGSEEALNYAIDLVKKIDEAYFDPKYKGYYETSFRNWKRSPFIKGMNRIPEDVKTMNTHLHLIEAYTCLLRVWRNNYTTNKVREHLHVMLNKIVNQDIHHYHCFLDNQWNPTSSEISYGHDIEGTWLMWETAEVLGEPESLRKTRDISVNMARAILEEGIAENGGCNTEYDPVSGHKTTRLSWWEQNETVVGFVNAWELTGEEKFLDAAIKCFENIDKNFIDHEKGGWFPYVEADGSHGKGVKANGWICPYHNCRMSMEIIERYRKMQAEEK